MKTLIISNAQRTVNVKYRTDLNTAADNNLNVLGIEGLTDSLQRTFAIPKVADHYQLKTFKDFCFSNNFRLESFNEGDIDTESPSTLQAITTALAISNNTSLTGGTRTVAYAGVTMTAVGGNGAFTWAVTTGALPAGLVLNATTGAISGTPSQASASTVNFSITATDAFGQTVTKSHSIAIA